MNEDVFLKVVAYACLYKAAEKHVGEIPIEEISITLIRKRFPRKLFQWLEEQGFHINKHEDGIYYIGDILNFAVQIIVTQELPQESRHWITLLHGDLSREEAKRAIQQANQLSDKAEKERKYQGNPCGAYGYIPVIRDGGKILFKIIEFRVII